ncbi:MAG: hypothetical protein LC642_05315 [Verrucomicrobiaceae bacterium]|nr:hypothetical protein [Verrucomicrobiaceae bacterium]
MNYFVQLRDDSPFFPIFSPRGFVPVKQVPVPNAYTTRGTRAMAFTTTALCGDRDEPEDAVWLDWTRCGAVQRTLLVKALADLRGGTISEVLLYLDRGGDLPIRVSQTVGAPFPL